MSSKLPFALGAYPNTPDSPSFVDDYNSFTQLMGAAPQYLDYFGDYWQSIDNWVGQAQYEANMAAGNALTSGTTPVFALPMYSMASGSLTPDQQYQSIVAGNEDNIFIGVVQAWAAAGFKDLVVRPGWEMNVPGNTYVGDSAQDQSDWVAAFQHIYTVLHQAAAAAGITMTVVWNPSTTNWSNAQATTNLYPGNDYVDAIGADVYSDIFPYSDTTSGAPEYHDWDTGGEDSSIAQFIADPVNRAHYWSYPAATEYADDGSGGHSQSLTSLLQFAEQQGKPFVVPETGAGSSQTGVDVSDDAMFPQWLAQQLTAAQSAGEDIGFVNVWDSNFPGNYEFSNTSDGKPQEAAAWAQYFGVQTPPSPETESITLYMAEDAYKGDAEFTVSVDGTQVGGTMTTHALHSLGDSDVFTLSGSWASGAHTVTIAFINDAYGGSASADRNLYVSAIAVNGTIQSDTAKLLYNNGSADFAVGGTVAAAAAPPDSLTVHLAEDAWNGDAQFVLRIDGRAVTTAQSVTTRFTTGSDASWEDFTVTGTFGAGSHTIGVQFTNDAWGGSATTDRNLYVNGLDLNGTHYGSGVTLMANNGTTNFQVTTTQ
jgi:hypothetical protein